MPVSINTNRFKYKNPSGSGYRGIDVLTQEILSGVSNVLVDNVSVVEDGVASIDLSGKANKTDTVLETTLSRGRKANSTVGVESFAFGDDVEASAIRATAFGAGTIASANNAFAEGAQTTASGTNSHAEGNTTVASGNYSHAEGRQTTASGAQSHAEGRLTTASGIAAHASGSGTSANAKAQTTIGSYNTESTLYPAWTANTSYVIGDKVTRNNSGKECIEANSDASFTDAKWKDLPSNSDYIFEIGNGADADHRSNALAVSIDGDVRAKGNLYVGCSADSSGGTRVPHDVQINGTSIVSNGVAEIPIGSGSTLGVYKVNATAGLYGISVTNDGEIRVQTASLEQIKSGTSTGKPIPPVYQHSAVFYGLAKAAGDSTQASSANSTGTYTETAKSAINSMLNAPEAISGTTPIIAAKAGVQYVCGEVSTLDFTPSPTGTCDVIFTSGSTPTVLTIPNTVKFPAWFNTSSLEADTTYEINVTNGNLGTVMLWA